MRCGNHESRTEHGRRRNVERHKIARRIETQRLAILGIQLENPCAARETNSHRPRYRFAQPNTTSASRSESGHLHDKSSATDRSRGAVICCLGSTGCQPVVVGSLPTTPKRYRDHGIIESFRRAFRQVAEKDRLAACAPQNPRRDLVEVRCRFALSLGNVTRF